MRVNSLLCDLCLWQVEQKLKWLDTMKQKKEVWVGRYTWGELTFGIHSTQRIESIHSSVARFCNKNHQISMIVKKLVNLADEHAFKSGIEAARAANRKIADRECAAFKMAQSLLGKVTGYAFDIVISEAAQVENYQVLLLREEDEKQVYSVGLTEASRAKAREYAKLRAKECSLARKSKKRKPVVKESMICKQTDCQNGKGVLNAAEKTPEAGPVCVTNEDGFGRDFIKANEKGHFTTLTKCSCQFVVSRGLPCRHMFCVASSLTSENTLEKVRTAEFYVDRVPNQLCSDCLTFINFECNMQSKQDWPLSIVYSKYKVGSNEGLRYEQNLPDQMVVPADFEDKA
ncbi:MAG: hypothetical protein ACREOZ_04035, partial [Gloeomargaritales cyanobacterium]